MEIDLKELERFIVEAKSKGYAGEGRETSTPDFPQFKVLRYEKDSYRYIDIYSGFRSFNGMEIVWFNNIPIWAMTYSGRVIKETKTVPVERIYEFLRKALLHNYNQGRFLGASYFKEKGLTYFDFNDGDVTGFTGHEEISYKKWVVYRLSSAGGLIK